MIYVLINLEQYAHRLLLNREEEEDEEPWSKNWHWKVLFFPRGESELKAATWSIFFSRGRRKVCGHMLNLEKGETRECIIKEAEWQGKKEWFIYCQATSHTLINTQLATFLLAVFSQNCDQAAKPLECGEIVSLLQERYELWCTYVFTFFTFEDGDGGGFALWSNWPRNIGIKASDWSLRRKRMYIRCVFSNYGGEIFCF